MGNPAAYQQLLEMGIPGGRARAALARAKDDVMAAAERVFAGEFDDIPSDDEGNEGESNKAGPSRPRASAGSQASDQSISRRIADDVVISDDAEEDDADLDGVDDGDEDDDEDIFDGFQGESGEDDEEEHRFSDPYAGIFFSKDRIEDVIETVAEPEYVNIKAPTGDPNRSAGTKLSVRILGSGEWMSGCPEGMEDEQSFLFQLYNKLSAEDVDCSNGCGHRFERKKQDFFAILPDFPAYLQHLNSIVRPACPKCAYLTCLACGQRCDRAAKPLRDNRGPGVTGSELATGMDALLHCVDLQARPPFSRQRKRPKLIIQGAILGVGLHMIEATFSDQSALSSSPPKTPPAKRRRKVPRAAALHTQAESGQLEEDDQELEDYASGMGLFGGKGKSAGATGTGYAGNTTEDIKAQAAQNASDAKIAKLLAQVQVYLPQLNRSDGPRTSDHLVHPTALAHLRRRSGFVNELLRNDSLLDMSNRGELYRALFDWLEVISGHEALASMLAMPQMRPVRTSAIPDQPGVVKVTYEGSSSPRELLESVVIQAKAALKGLESTSVKEDKDEVQEMTEEEMRLSKDEARELEAKKKVSAAADENQQLKDFCNRIVTSAHTIDRSLVETKGKDFVKRMKASLPRLPGEEDQELDVNGSVTAPSGASVEAVIKIYEEWAMKARFQYSDLSYTAESKLAYHHAYSSSVTAIEGQNVPRRSLAIAKELAILTTNLPVAWSSSIFLRVDESRVDCIKALITGPEGTPYQDGCFIFDIFLPLEYNQKCPTVKSMTTNGGRYRYNPNLYADGKVCLSLLGTWSGPGWISGQSTLLQVLISIQSLILCEDPYCNEPGWANDGGSPQSKAYSANIRRMVLVDAMAGNIKHPPFPFENEIETHFRLKAASIRSLLDKWEKLDDDRAVQEDGAYMGSVVTVPRAGGVAGREVKTAFERAADELRGLLDGLEKGDGGGEAEPDPAVADTAGAASESARVTRSKVGKEVDKGQ